MGLQLIDNWTLVPQATTRYGIKEGGEEESQVMVLRGVTGKLQMPRRGSRALPVVS